MLAYPTIDHVKFIIISLTVFMFYLSIMVRCNDDKKKKKSHMKKGFLQYYVTYNSEAIKG